MQIINENEKLKKKKKNGSKTQILWNVYISFTECYTSYLQEKEAMFYGDPYAIIKA